MLAVQIFEPTNNWDRRAFFKPILERIFAPQIYAAVIQALVACKKNEEGKPFLRFSKADIIWLSRTFTRENIGAQEEAYVCMFPAYDYTKDKEDKEKSKAWRKYATEGKEAEKDK